MTHIHKSMVHKSSTHSTSHTWILLVLTCINVSAGLCGGLLFDTWFFSSGKHSLVKAASSWITQGSAVPNQLAQTIKQKQGYLWYACQFPSSTIFH